LDIEVVGATVYLKEEIIDASGIATGDNMLFLNTQDASRRIKSEMPYIHEALITRVPPSAILIKVTESVALAAIKYQESVLIIDSNCKVLKISNSAPKGLIEVRGLSHETPVEGRSLKAEPGSDNHLQYVKDILAAIEKEGIEKDVSYLDVSNTSKISLGYKGRFIVVLGSPGNVRNKLNQLPGLVPEIEAESSVDAKGEINMSDPTGRWVFNPNR
jgi:hypothetical protein